MKHTPFMLISLNMHEIKCFVKELPLQNKYFEQ